MIVVMTKLELVRELRRIAAEKDCHLTLRAANAIADWIKAEGTGKGG